jgi:Ion channel
MVPPDTQANENIFSMSGLAIFSPTRALVNHLKSKKNLSDKRRLLISWSCGFLTISVLTAISIFVLVHFDMLAVRWHFIFFIIPYCRINEISWAFLKDIPAQLQQSKDPSELTPTIRLSQAARSYVETMINFGIVYFMLPASCFRFASVDTKAFANIGEAVYFSGATITTTGYGDITPKHGVSEFLCLYELAVGLVLIVGAVASYISIGAGQPDVHASNCRLKSQNRSGHPR